MLLYHFSLLSLDIVLLVLSAQLSQGKVLVALSEEIQAPFGL